MLNGIKLFNKLALQIQGYCVLFSMPENTFLLYGANGYTGELIARYAGEYSLRPVLAGRNNAAIEALAYRLQLPFRAFDLRDAAARFDALKNVKVLVNAAGPFSATAKEMVETCLQTGTHYLDINGDITVFEQLKKYDAAAKKAGILLLPGVGFDVVPTDCLALLLKKSLPDANTVQLAFTTLGGSISHGTATTMVTRLGEKGAMRKAGEIIKVPLGNKGMEVDFGSKKRFVMSIPWGDISTAYTTTGIPDIETYTGIKPSVYKLLKLQWIFNWLLRTGMVRKFVKNKINNRPAGPSDEQRGKALSLVWGRATNAAGKQVTATLTCPEGYTLTTHATLLINQKVLKGIFTTGYQTPAGLYGEDLVLEIPGVQRNGPNR